jgi:hypothetical protein
MAIVKLYNVQLDRLLNDSDGEVGRYLSKKGDQIRTIARTRVGVRTGRLKATMHKRHLRDPRGQYILVGNDAPYALAHHEGSRPRVVRPTGSKVLRFVARGQVVFAQQVMHPGTKPNKYLLDALKIAL